MKKTLTVRFLRLFADYVSSEYSGEVLMKQNVEAGRVQREMQGQMNELRDEIRCLKEERDKAIDSERSSYQMLINVEFKQKYGMTPFPEAPTIPDVTGDLSPVGGTMSARGATRIGREQFREDMAELSKGDTQ